MREQIFEVIIARPDFHRFPIDKTLIIKNLLVRRRVFLRMWLT